MSIRRGYPPAERESRRVTAEGRARRGVSSVLGALRARARAPL